jgi:hypothetical protein
MQQECNSDRDWYVLAVVDLAGVEAKDKGDDKQRATSKENVFNVHGAQGKSGDQEQEQDGSCSTTCLRYGAVRHTKIAPWELLPKSRQRQSLIFVHISIRSNLRREFFMVGLSAS